MKRSRIPAVCIAIIFTATGLEAAPPEAKPTLPLTVVFRDCIESIGVALVATESARALTPAGFVLVGEGQPVTPLVVRTSRCRDVSVDGHGAEPGAIVQIGAVIVPPDFTGDINNYTFWYETSSPRARSRAPGHRRPRPARRDHRRRLRVDGRSGALRGDGTASGRPSPLLEGTVVESRLQRARSPRLVASDRSRFRKIAVPVILIGAADLASTTAPSGPRAAQRAEARLKAVRRLQQFKGSTRRG